MTSPARDIIYLIMASSGASVLPQSSRPPKVAFGPFEFDRASGKLWKNGHKVKLPRQPAEILSALITHPGEVVTREDLRIRLWPGITSGDVEHGVNAAVNKLRQVLGDAATEPRYIETLPGAVTALWRWYRRRAGAFCNWFPPVRRWRRSRSHPGGDS